MRQSSRRDHAPVSATPGGPAAPAGECRYPLRSSLIVAHNKPQMRAATMIQASTGERIKKTFTLRRPREGSHGSAEFLLAPGQFESDRHRDMGRMERFREQCKGKVEGAYGFATSPTGINILKCSLAYILGSLATFVPPISGLLGRNDGKHMVATGK